MKSKSGYCTKWGSEMGAREVHGLTKDEKQVIKSGCIVQIDGPAYKGISVRTVVCINGRYYARMPAKETTA